MVSAVRICCKCKAENTLPKFNCSCGHLLCTQCTVVVSAPTENTIGVKYSCALCGIVKKEVQVKVRGPNEDVVSWVKDTVGHALGYDHMKASPSCQTTKLSEVMIPITGAPRVGDPSTS